MAKSEIMRARYLSNTDSYDYSENRRDLMNKILDLLEEGKKRSEIASELHISRRNVTKILKSYKEQSMMDSMRVHSKREPKPMTKEEFMKMVTERGLVHQKN